MYAIQNYTNTKCELDMAKTRLQLLVDRKTELYNKYFPIIVQPKEVNVDGGIKTNSKMAEYLYELHNVIDVGTGMSLATEIEYEQKNVDKLQSYIDKLDSILSNMIGIEYELFYEIIYKGTKVTKAVENIAERYDADVRTVWRAYKRTKKYIKKINQLSVICQ